MTAFDTSIFKKLVLPDVSSHKGQNGKLMVIGGSHLFHAASLWALTIASRVVDMVFYSSVTENNTLISDIKREFRNGIVVPRLDIEQYINEADCILIGPGMLRTEDKGITEKTPLTLAQIDSLPEEGKQSYFLLKYLLEKYPQKKWVIDAGALQMLVPEWLLPLEGRAILTPHPGELERVIANSTDQVFQKTCEGEILSDKVSLLSKKYSCVVLLKDQIDVVCSPNVCWYVPGGNPGLTKGGTGDVLAGFVASLACRNDLFIAASIGSYINKKAGDNLFKKVSYFYNSSDLVNEIPVAFKECIDGFK